LFARLPDRQNVKRQTSRSKRRCHKKLKSLDFAVDGHSAQLRGHWAYKLANDGQDTRAIQHYLGHQNIQHTTRYTELASDRFRAFWSD